MYHVCMYVWIYICTYVEIANVEPLKLMSQQHSYFLIFVPEKALTSLLRC